MSDKRLGEFWGLVNKGGECWTWDGYKLKGYGHFYLSQFKKIKSAHRISYFLTHGEWGNHILHSCDNKACVNPAHLRSGTHQENMREASERKRFPLSRLTHCKRGHEFTEENTYQYGSSRHCRTCAIVTATAHQKVTRAKKKAALCL